MLKGLKYPLVLQIVTTVLVCACDPGLQQKKVYYINSYHQGYGSSDDIMEGIEETLKGKAELRIFYLDSKRESDPVDIGAKAKLALDDIHTYDPDIIIASDDNAVKYVIVPYFNKNNIPVVFCGVNWSADEYDLSPSSVTGMLEVLPFTQAVEVARESFPNIHTMTVLSENTATEQKNKTVMQPIFDDLGLQVEFALVDVFESWKNAFLDANNRSDLIYIPTNGAIKNWDEDVAKAWVAEQIRKPVITCDDFMMPYAAFGMTKVAKEQGIWAANTALKILNGIDIKTLPIAKSKQYVPWLNRKLADKIGLKLDPEMMPETKIIE